MDLITVDKCGLRRDGLIAIDVTELLPATEDVENLWPLRLSGCRGLRSRSHLHLTHKTQREQRPRELDRLSPAQVSPGHPWMPRHPTFSGTFPGFSPGNQGGTQHTERSWEFGGAQPPSFLSTSVTRKGQLSPLHGSPRRWPKPSQKSLPGPSERLRAKAASCSAPPRAWPWPPCPC